ncbi:hypothetical protein [Spiroplasma endosymbiont of Aleiodes alternator]|uniref:hypothetical protein n=1 Tax=Spiroplasma endosymbiont of Aleiodes alternator TaxID=3139329 RepID=UPI003CCB0721
MWYFFAVDLTKLNLDLNGTYKGNGDGSIAEKDISARFVNEQQLRKAIDSLSLATFAKLDIKLKEKWKIEFEEIEIFCKNNFNKTEIEITQEDIDKLDENMFENWNKYLDNKLKESYESGLILNSSCTIVEELKKEAQEYENDNSKSIFNNCTIL